MSYTRDESLVTANVLQYVPLLQELKNEFPEQVEILSKDLFTLAKLAFQDNQDGGSRVKSLFYGVTKAKWEDGRY
jgi:hypothetical protein